MGEEEDAHREPPARPERTRLRRRPLGYSRADVHEVLEARDRELAELRQDVAALWLAFARHERVLSDLNPNPAPPAPPTAAGERPATTPGTETPSIGEQLAELDEVLAAIELATQSLERTYADEVRAAGGATPGARTDEDGTRHPT